MDLYGPACLNNPLTGGFNLNWMLQCPHELRALPSQKNISVKKAGLSVRLLCTMDGGRSKFAPDSKEDSVG